MKKQILSIILCATFAWSGCYSTRITGQLRVVGNEPFSRLVIETSDAVQYQIRTNDATRAMMQRDFANRNVVVRGKVRRATSENGATIKVLHVKGCQ